MTGMLRRSFMSRLAGMATMLGFGQAGTPPTSVTPSSPSSSSPGAASPSPPWQAARHAQDEWWEAAAVKHRVIFDTWGTVNFPEALQFAGNYIRVNKDEYGVAEKDLSVVICVRHRTAPFAYNDAMWAKYGKAFSQRMQFTDPKTHEAPSSNIYAAQISNLLKQGLQLAVCSLTTRAYTRIIAQETGGDAEGVYKELVANTLGNSHFVPAGVVAVTRAQERGYAVVSIG
jgi:hypothetical protein